MKIVSSSSSISRDWRKIGTEECGEARGEGNTTIPLDGVSATFRIFGQNDTKRGRNAKSVAETPRAQ